ncbi:MAG: sigma-70 family RNA polymerase sigma factor [Planctomycetota bacterium]
MPRRPQSTEELLIAARSGDAEALEELFRVHLDALRRFVRSRAGATLRQSECTWDLVQTACRQALPKVGEFEWRGPGTFRSWLCAFAVAKMQNRRQYHRADKRDVARRQELDDAPDPSAAPPARAIAREEVARLAVALEELPEQYREVIVRARLLGLSHREIAADLGKSEGAVRVLLFRAVARLGTLLADPSEGDATGAPAADTT